VDTKALKLTAIAATMLDGFVPTSWTPLPPLDPAYCVGAAPMLHRPYASF